MKKYFSLLLIALFSFTLISCVDDNSDYVDTDTDTYPVAYDFKNVNFTYDSTNDYYFIYEKFNSSLIESDVVLIYRQSYIDSSGNPVWQLIPRTLYLDEGELDYDYDFTKNDIEIRAGGTIDLYAQTTTFKNAYLNGQTFRVVIVPAATGTAKINYSDYNVVAARYGIKESEVKTL